MNAVDLILKKREGKHLSGVEWKELIHGYVRDEIPDYQMAAFLMAVYFQGMDERETVDLTRIMMESGDQMDLSAIGGIVVDKHSTGGVGDTTTLILAPWLAACGVPVAKMSGRGLGHTGGTIDKMESIPGFRTSLTMDEFVDNVRTIGIALAGQTGHIAPADKKLYALRDVTGTVDQRSLIASSVMSKKLASGAQAIVLDVKVGLGAFMKNLNQGASLAKTMIDIGTAMGRETVALLTNMDQPLGNAVGNAVEVMEAVRVLTNQEKGDLYKVSFELATQMLLLAGKGYTEKEARLRLVQVLDKGEAYEKFLEWIVKQGGDAKAVEKGLPLGKHSITWNAPMRGVIHGLDSSRVGHAALELGAGRSTKESPIDLGAGIRLFKRVGDTVEAGEPLAVLYSNSEKKLKPALDHLSSGLNLGVQPVAPPTLLLGKVDKEGVIFF